jgi:serine/threonine protein kinase
MIDDSGRAMVYKGYSPDQNRYVAVKVLKPEAQNEPSVVASFVKYAQLAAGSGSMNRTRLMYTPNRR